MTGHLTLSGLTEPALVRLAELLAFSLRVGDLIALHGDLGAGKTTFARALIEGMAHPHHVEVPSPTFTLVQSYEMARLAVAHFDLYRLNDPSEIDELGFEDCVMRGAALVEWPDRAGERLIGTRLDIGIAETASGDGNLRDVTLTADEGWEHRLNRLGIIREFLHTSGYDAHAIRYLQGDASVRRYARLIAADGTPRILMDWPRQPDGPPIRDGKPYSKIAHLAEDVAPFVAIAERLAADGMSVPRVLAQDLDAGLLVIEDFGDRVFGVEMKASGNQAQLWRAGVDALVAMRQLTPPETLTLSGQRPLAMPRYNQEALGIETELLLDWYWPALHGTAAPTAMRDEYLALWTAVFDRLATLPQGWVLRDFHSPNLLWLPERPAPRNVGLIDFQDAQIGPHAYDLVSLLQDARVDVSAELEAELLAHYCGHVAAIDPTFQQPSFAWSYAALGAQRNSKILGIFARLAHRDGKPQYLGHIPRIWGYLSRNLDHPELAGLASWYHRAFPKGQRAQSLSSTRERS
jgi:N-acetylmuramate 1-kinase